PPALFFFQAEDGIRDYKVTGVQTCALPISPAGRWRGARLSVIRSDQARVDVADFAFFGLDARENKSVELDGEALAAGNGSDRVRSEERRVGKECGCGWWRGG